MRGCVTDCCNVIAADGNAGVEYRRVNAPGPVMKLIPRGQKVTLFLATCLWFVEKQTAEHLTVSALQILQ